MSSSELLRRLEAQKKERQGKVQQFLASRAALNEASNRSPDARPSPTTGRPAAHSQQQQQQAAARAQQPPCSPPKARAPDRLGQRQQHLTPPPAKARENSTPHVSTPQSSSVRGSDSQQQPADAAQAAHLRALAIERLAQQFQREQLAGVQTLAEALTLQQTLLAAVHYSRRLVRCWGLQPWLALLQLRQQHAQEARLHYARSQLRGALSSWRGFLHQARWGVVCRQACALAQCRLVRQRLTAAAGLRAFRQAVDQARARAAAADCVRHQRLASQALEAWRTHTAQAAAHNTELTQAAAAIRQRKFLSRVWAAWCRAAVALRQERQLQQRQEQQWGRVQEWLQQHRAERRPPAAAAEPAVNAAAMVGSVAAAPESDVLSLAGLPSFKEHMAARQAGA